MWEYFLILQRLIFIKPMSRFLLCVVFLCLTPVIVRAQTPVMDHPLDLKFTAVDGKKVDLSKMRGKVVLIGFWATWCPGCREELPVILGAYKKYHDKGFEVIGISLDQDKDEMLDFTKKNGMVWPQYFDGKGWENSISHGFGISGIPVTWLIDKKGIIMTNEEAYNLNDEVEKLLKAP